MTLRIIVLALLLTGCGDGSTSVQVEPSAPESPAGVFQRAGDAALEQERFEQARDAYEKAVALSPRDPLLHYRLGVVLSHLHQVHEARRAFERVLILSPPQTKAAAFSREWLKTQGVDFDQSRSAQTGRVPLPAVADNDAPGKPIESTEHDGVLVGQVGWTFSDGRREPLVGRSVELHHAAGSGARLDWKITDSEGRFRFDGLQAGRYRLRVFYAGPTPLWETTVEVSPKQTMVVDLTEANAMSSTARSQR